MLFVQNGPGEIPLKTELTLDRNIKTFFVIFVSKSVKNALWSL